MSGAEAPVVLGVIGAILEITKTIIGVYTTAQNLTGLPEAFSLVGRRLPIIQDILKSAEEHLAAETNEAVFRAIKPTVDQCAEDIRSLEEIFAEVKPVDGVWKWERYRKAVKARGKGSRVETLMISIFTDVQLLNSHRGMKMPAENQSRSILDAIEELKAVSPSVPESEFRDSSFITNSGVQQYVASGQGFMSAGSSRQYFAQSIIFENDTHKLEEKDSCLRALFLTNPRDDREYLTTTKAWLYSSSELLWVSGTPGQGKTMIAIYLAEKLEQMAQNSANTLFLQYFCDNKDEKRNTAVAILRSLLFQLLQLQPKLFDHILPSFRVQGESLFTSLSFETLWRIFQSMICDTRLGKVYCILDGLDEYEEVSLEMLLNKLAPLFFSTKSNKSSACHLNLLILSRDYPELIPNSLFSFPRICLESDSESEVKNDILRFIDMKVKELSIFRKYPERLSEHVKRVFQARAQGTFLWIGIVAKAMQKYKASEAETALEYFPQGLDMLYSRILLQIDINQRDIAAQILHWVVMAIRPLTILELSVAIEVSKEDSLLFSREQVMRDRVLNCGYFLAIKGDEINLVHQSAKDYLLRKTPDSDPELELFRIKEKEANLVIARKCFNYLQNGSLVAGPVDLETDHFHLKRFPLLPYATLYWPEHSRTLAHSEDIFDLSLPFYGAESKARKVTSTLLIHLIAFGLILWNYTACRESPAQTHI
ncbi:MAG: hypothetical protein M1829_005369 [Trizodia sp. TS-e1964]|nr:MAG: hypothetical protein M1829_005369 [Trizodia sp. TS-e1964]